MSENLFTPASSELWRQNAVAGGYYCHPYVFLEGYYRAAEVLVTSALGDSRRSSDFTFLFHPICYNYRHYIELSLKNLIIKSEKLYYILEKLDSVQGKITESVIPKLTETHRVKTLLDWLNERTKFVSGRGLDKKIKNLITQFDDIDPDGQNFRYPLRTDGNPSLPEQFGTDLEILREHMEEVHTHLSGIGDWLDDGIRDASELLNELQQHYGTA